MRIFATALTVYLYDNDYRKMLNMQEAEKFNLAMEHISDVDEYYVFTEYRSVDEIKRAVSNLSKDERESMDSFVVSRLKIIMKSGKLKMVPANTADYMDTHRAVQDTIVRKVENMRDEVEIIANTSCGHKAGAIALYVALMELSTKLKRVKYNPFHAEEEITPMPNVNIKTIVQERVYEEYLSVFVEPITFNEAIERVKKMGGTEKEASDAIAVLLNNRRLIEQRGEKRLVLSERGRTLLALLNALSEVG